MLYQYQLRFINWKNAIYAFVITGIFLLLISVFHFTLVSAAHSAKPEVVERVEYFESVQVQQGETLWIISDRYYSSDYKSKDNYIKKIMSLNHMTSRDIHAGSYLVIPYYSSVSL